LKRWNKELDNLRLSDITVTYIDDYKLKRIKEVKAVTVNSHPLCRRGYSGTEK